MKFSNIIPREALNIWPMLFDGRISASLFLKYLSSSFSSDDPSKNKLGLRTLYSNKGGYQKDGSYIYLDIFNDLDLLAKEQEAAITSEVPNGGVPLIPKNEKFCNSMTNDLRYAYDYLQKRGIKLVVFLTPLPERHSRRIMDIDYGRKFYEAMKEELKTLEPQIAVKDYLNPDDVVFDDREFIDQSHAGEVIALRILLDLSNYHTFLKNYIDVDFVKSQIQECRNKPMCIKDFKKYLIPEN